MCGSLRRHHATEPNVGCPLDSEAFPVASCQTLHAATSAAGQTRTKKTDSLTRRRKVAKASSAPRLRVLAPLRGVLCSSCSRLWTLDRISASMSLTVPQFSTVSFTREHDRTTDKTPVEIPSECRVLREPRAESECHLDTVGRGQRSLRRGSNGRSCRCQDASHPSPVAERTDRTSHRYDPGNGAPSPGYNSAQQFGGHYVDAFLGLRCPNDGCHYLSWPFSSRSERNRSLITPMSRDATSPRSA